MKRLLVTGLAVLGLGGIALAAPPGPIDGSDIPTDYADATTLGVQTNRTGFGDQDVTTTRLFTEGNELDALYLAVDNASIPPRLHIGLAGNLNDIGNSFMIFIDSGEFGQIGELRTEGVGGPPFTLQQAGRIVTIDTNGTPGVLTDDTSTVVPNSAMVLPDCGLGGSFTGWDFVAAVDTFSGGMNVSEYILFDFDIGTTGPGTECIYDPAVGRVPCEPTPGNPADDFQLRASRTFVASSALNDGNAVFEGGNPAANYTGGFFNTNTTGVTDVDATMAAVTTTGLEIGIPLQRINFLNGPFRIMVLVMDGDENGFSSFTQGFGTVLNQTMPPISSNGACDAPTALGVRPDISALVSCVSGDTATLPAYTGTPEGIIHASEYGAMAPTETQVCPTDYGDRVFSTNGITPTAGGSELDVMHASNDNQFLYLAMTGNIERNGNSINIFIDADSNGDLGEHVVDFGANSNGVGPQIGGMEGIELPNGSSNGLPDPDDLAVKYNVAYGMNAAGDAVFLDFYDLVNDTFTFRGLVISGSGSNGLLPSASDPVNNPNGLLLGANNVNSAGVIGCGDGAPCFLETPDQVAARARTADLGFEMAIPLRDIGLDASDLPRQIRVFAHVGNQDGKFASDQGLPSMRNQSAAGSQVSNFGGPLFTGNSNFTDPFNLTPTIAYEARAADYCLGVVDGDADCDGDNDLADMQLLQLCVEDAGGVVAFSRPLPIECERLDRTGDNRVTEADMAAITALLDAGGPQ